MNAVRYSALSMGLLFGAAISLHAGDGQWTSEGLPHTSVFSLAIGQSPKTLFAGTHLGVYRSTEAGTWIPLSGSPADANVIAVDPSDSAILYAGGYSSSGWGLHKSTDGGDHFEMLAGISFIVEAIAIDPAEPDTVYVGGDRSRVLKSIDGGATWAGPPNPENEDIVTRIEALVIDPTRPGTLYAGSDRGLDSSSYYSYHYYLPPTAPVLRSVDSGTHWTPALVQAVDVVNPIFASALAVDPLAGTLYAATWDNHGASVFRSPDAGSTWTPTRIEFAGLVTALLADPIRTTTVYAGTDRAGVFRSVDGGASWSPLNDGLEDLSVSSLVFDPDDASLRAGTGSGIFAIRPGNPSPPCAPAAGHLCMLDGRFRVSLMARNPRTGLVTRGDVVHAGNRFGAFSLPAFTGDPDFPEVAVKMVDPLLDGRVWVFHAGLTSLPYILSITDTTTGRIETYTNDPQNRFCGGADTAAFFEEESSPWDYGRQSSPAASRAKSESGALSLLDGRFSVTLSAFSPRHNRNESGVAVPGTDRYGYFSLPGFTGDPSFPEVYVKMVDYTAITGNFWFFHTGLTGLDYTLTVTDAVTGAVRTYEGSGDFCAGADASPFTN